MQEIYLFKRLEAVADLSDQDRSEFRALMGDIKTTEARRDIISDGDRPEHLHLIVEGWAARYKVLPDGSRQITAFLIPGDFCDMHLTVLGEMDHGIVALSDCKFANIASKAFDRVLAANARLTRAILWSTLVDEAVTREWVVNVGRREAYERVAHILCEMHCRMQMIGLVQGNSLNLPLTQETLADATGLTPVHINRTLKRLRQDNLIEIGGGELNVLDIAALKTVAGFDARYLQIKRRVPVR